MAMADVWSFAASIELPPTLSPFNQFTSSSDVIAWHSVLKTFQTAFALDQRLRRHALAVLLCEFFPRGTVRKQLATNLKIALDQYEERFRALIQSHTQYSEARMRPRFARVLQIALDQYQQDWQSQVAFQGLLFLGQPQDADKATRYSTYLSATQADFVQQRVRLLHHSIKEQEQEHDANQLATNDVDLHVAVSSLAVKDLHMPHVSSHIDQPVSANTAHLMSTSELDDITGNFFSD